MNLKILTKLLRGARAASAGSGFGLVEKISTRIITYPADQQSREDID